MNRKVIDYIESIEPGVEIKQVAEDYYATSTGHIYNDRARFGNPKAPAKRLRGKYLKLVTPDGIVNVRPENVVAKYFPERFDPIARIRDRNVKGEIRHMAGFPDTYFITEHGRMFRCDGNGLLELKGYIRTRDGVTYRRLSAAAACHEVHRLLGVTFQDRIERLTDAPVEEADIIHKNGCTTDNRLSNLAIATRTQNRETAFQNDAHQRQLTPELVRALVEEWLNSEITIADLAERHGLTVHHVRSVVSGNRYRYLHDDAVLQRLREVYPSRRYLTRTSPRRADYEAVHRLHKAGRNAAEIGRELGIPQCTAWRLVTGKARAYKAMYGQP